jgi:hypothetical protein
METITQQEPLSEGSTTTPWASLGMVLTVLVAGAFATGWHFGRRWTRVLGW